MQAAMSSSGYPPHLDSQALLEEQNASAATIQKYWKAMRLRRLEVRQKFCHTLCALVQDVDWKYFGPNSDFIRQLLFFFNAKKGEDIDMLCQICDILLQYVKTDGDLVSLFGGVDSCEVKSFVFDRVRKLTLLCLHALHEKRFDWVGQPEASAESKPTPFGNLLEFVICLLNPKLPWNCEVVGYLQRKKVYCVFRGIISAFLQNERHLKHLDCSSALNKILAIVALHVGKHPCCCLNVDPRWSFCSQILSIPSLWHYLPDFKKEFYANGFSSSYTHQIASFVPSSADILPNDLLANHPGQACLLANVLETATWILSKPDFASESGAEIIDVCTSLLDAFPYLISPIERTFVDGTIPIENDNNCIDVDLQKHISTMVQHLVNAAVNGMLSIDCSDPAGPSSAELQFVGSINYFLHGILRTTVIDGIMTELVYNTEIVPALWNFIKSRHTIDKWQSFSEYCSPLLSDTPGWLLPLSVFCPMYSHIIGFMDIVELKNCEKPISLQDLPSLVSILKEALWELLLTIPLQTSSLQMISLNPLDSKKMLIEILKRSVRTGLCELLIQLEDWNNMDQFVPPIDFCSKTDFGDEFVSQAIIVGTHEAEIIRLAPFLVPYNIRLEIFQLHLAADHLRLANSRQASKSRTLEISRTNLLEDAFNKLSVLSAEDLKGRIQIVFFNEHGMREAGVDGGGIFRDFMNIITQKAFGMAARLFKETADHLLYPNPESKLAGTDHLQYFHFLGVLLGKAIYERITIGLSFTIFFLRKLKHKATFFNDLFSLDPELYRYLVNLKNSDDISYLYFTTVDGKELLPGGARMHVTTYNVITYMHLVANYQLNCQNREQTAQFLRGFQQLIPKEWTDMFNEHEFQLIISGPLRLNVDDLRLNTNYGGEYNVDHEVILIFWKVLGSFIQSHQELFLMFVTGCARGPIRGFRTLDPKFGIISYGDDTNRLPLASTCINQLKLPPYQTEEQMHEKLILAISSNAGFDRM